MFNIKNKKYITLYKNISLAILFFFCSSGMNAQDFDKPISAKFLLEFGAEWGGDELITVQFTNGNEQTMYAGQGIHLVAGTELAFSKVEDLLLRMSIGLKWSPTAADNANIAFTRLPIIVSPFWKIKNNFRVGVGATAHLFPKFHGDGFVDDVKFSSSLGPRFEFGYKWIAITYTLMKYESEFGELIDGNAFGVMLSYSFSGKKK